MSRSLELVSKRLREHHDHAELKKGEVVGGLAVAADGDPTLRLQPRIRALDRPAVACLPVGGLETSPLAAPDDARRRPCRDLLAGLAPLTDARLDLPLTQRLLERLRGIAAVGPHFGRSDPPSRERVDERQQVPLFVLVAGG